VVPLSAVSSAYEAGQALAMVVLAALLVALVVRAVRRKARLGQLPVTDVIAAVIVTALLVASVARLGGGDQTDPWASQEGKELRAGFIAGCGDSSNGVVDCTCVFDEIRSEAPYDTPSEFASLAGPVMAAQQAQDLNAVPGIIIRSVQACRAGA
jgi:hypothetical protein